MIKVSSKKNKYTYNVYHLVKAFFPNEEIIQNVDEKQESLVALNLPGGSCFSIALEEVEAAAGDLSEMETEEAKEQAIKRTDSFVVPISRTTDKDNACMGNTYRSAADKTCHDKIGTI